MKKMTIVATVLIGMMFMGTSCFGQYNMATMKEDALYNLDIAKEFTSRGQDILRTQPTVDNMKIASYLYQEAGKLYEKSRVMFQTVNDPNYSKVCGESVRVCIDTIKEINKRIAQTRSSRRRR